MVGIDRICESCRLTFESRNRRIYCEACEEIIHSKKLKDFICQECSITFQAYPLSNRKYCSKKCRVLKSKKKYRIDNVLNLNLATGIVGTISELRACVDLLSKGFQVYRSISQYAKCGLAIILKDKLYRVEVTTGYYSKNGNKYHSKKNKNDYDILAIVMKSGEIFYEPNLPIY